MMLRHQRFKFVRAAFFFLRGKHELLMMFARKKINMEIGNIVDIFCTVAWASNISWDL